MPVYRTYLRIFARPFLSPFPTPVHDGYVVFSILRALDQVDALKSQRRFSARRPSRITSERGATGRRTHGHTLETVIPQLVRYLQGMFIWGHPHSQINVVPNPSIASIIGVLLPLTYNPNLCSDESGRRFSEAEVRAMAMTAELVGYDPDVPGGVFTFGGTGGLLYGVKVGLEKAVPGLGEARA